MLTVRVSLASQSLLDPDLSVWENVEGERVRLVATPLYNQPSEYVKVAGAQWKYGATEYVKVKSVHNGQDIFFRLEWEDPNKDIELKDRFLDGAGLLFPLHEAALPFTMGEKNRPVNAWFWRADSKGEAKNMTAEGLGTTEKTQNSHVLVEARWKDGAWRVVMGRSLTVADKAVQFEAGAPYKIAFAVWQGSNLERAGLKSYSGAWLECEVAE